MLLATSCGPSGAGQTGDVPTGRAVTSASLDRLHDWSASGCALPQVAHEVSGRSARVLIHSYGAPAGDARFTLGTGLTSDRQILINVLPMRGNEARVVRELVWVRGRCRLTVWLIPRGREWVAVQSLRGLATSES